MLLYTVVVMVFIELVQGALVEGRAFDVDDVLLNTSGALLGYLVLGRRMGRGFHHLGERRRKGAEAGRTWRFGERRAAAPRR